MCTPDAGAHARRGFIKALEALPKAARTPDQPAAKMIEAIGQLYAVDSAAEALGAEQRLHRREEHSRAIVQTIQALVLGHLHTVDPESLLGKALHYLHGQWPKMVRFLERGDMPLDNNTSENALRPYTVGKDCLFSDTVAGSKASANLYSLIETAKACGFEPYQYLRHVFARLPLARTADDYEALLPWRVNLKKLPIGSCHAHLRPARDVVD